MVRMMVRRRNSGISVVVRQGSIGKERRSGNERRDWGHIGRWGVRDGGGMSSVLRRGSGFLPLVK